MNWKKWPYWIKGGIIFGLVGFLYAILPIILAMTVVTSGKEIGGTLPTILYPQNVFVNFWCDNFVFPQQPVSNKSCDILTPQILIIILIAVIGILLGWLYGKIKNRRTANVNGKIS